MFVLTLKIIKLVLTKKKLLLKSYFAELQCRSLSCSLIFNDRHCGQYKITGKSTAMLIFLFQFCLSQSKHTTKKTDRNNMSF